MDFASESFSVVLDKGKLDSILNEGSGQVSEHLNQTLDEIQRILRTGGRYLCLTLAPQQVLNKLLNQFSSGWFVRIHKVELEKIPNESLVPLFVCVFTKTRFISSVASDTGAQIPKVLEVCLHGTDIIERVDSVDCIKSVIQECQAYFVIHKKLGKTVKATDTLKFSCKYFYSYPTIFFVYQETTILKRGLRWTYGQLLEQRKKKSIPDTAFLLLTYQLLKARMAHLQSSSYHKVSSPH